MTRKEIILKLIVEHFVKTAEPVASQALIDYYHLEYSSATIRNEMKTLEEEGLIEKPHTSAGRIPSTKGYQYYVEHLRTHRLDKDIKLQLQQVFDRRHSNIEEVIKEGCEILSQMTNLAVVMLGKDAKEDILKDIQLVEISSTTAMCIFVMESTEVATRKFQIPPEVTNSQLKSCIKIFRERLVGTKVADVGDRLMALKPLVNDYVESYELLFRTFLDALLTLNSEKMSVFGVSNLFDQIEFASDVERFKKLMKMLENQSVWSSLDSHGPLQVSIDSEKEGVSVIHTNTVGGTLALVGPTRMDYDRIIEAFDFLRKQIEAMMKGEKE